MQMLLEWQTSHLHAQNTTNHVRGSNKDRLSTQEMCHLSPVHAVDEKHSALFHLKKKKKLARKISP